LIDIANSEFVFDLPPVGEEQLQLYATKVFDGWDAELLSGLPFEEYSVHLELLEGSLKGKGTILTSLSVLYFGIAQYGSFIQGLGINAKQAQWANATLVREATAVFDAMSPEPAKTKRDTGRVGDLQRLFRRVRSGDLSPEEAAQAADELFADESGDSPDFMRAARSSLLHTHRSWEQLGLELGEVETMPIIEAARPRKPARLPPLVPVVPPLRYRVEIWRESKKGPKRISSEPI
jgi:hypothetical protein